MQLIAINRCPAVIYIYIISTIIYFCTEPFIRRVYQINSEYKNGIIYQLISIQKGQHVLFKFPVIVYITTLMLVKVWTGLQRLFKHSQMNGLQAVDQFWWPAERTTLLHGYLLWTNLMKNRSLKGSEETKYMEEAGLNLYRCLCVSCFPAICWLCLCSL